MSDTHRIKDLSEDDRPREKLMKLGRQALSDAELLAIIIGSGSTTESAVQLMQCVLDGCGGDLALLSKLTISELCRYKGIGEAKAISIIAAGELGARRVSQRVSRQRQVKNAEDIFSFYAHLRSLTVEEFHVLLLNTKLGILGTRLICRGGRASTIVDIRCVMEAALTAGATAIAVCHNHPSGATEPSRADDDLTRRIQEACRVMDIRLIDHVVVGEGYYSYADQGKL